MSVAEELLNNNEYNMNSFQVLQLANESGYSAYACEFLVLEGSVSIPL